MATTSAPSPLDQVRDLETQFSTAMTQLYAVGNGLARVRLDLESGAAPQTSAQSVPRPVAARAEGRPTVEIPPIPRRLPDPHGAAGAVRGAGAVRAAGAPSAAATPPAAAPVAAAPPASTPLTPRPRWWERPGAVAKVLGAVGAVVTLIGVAFLLAIAIAAGIFGPVPRTIAGALLAAALLTGGVAVRRRSPDSPGGAALAATGLAAAYLDLLAATAIYHFIPGPAGLALAAVLAVGGFALARAWDSQLLAILAAAPPMLLAPAITGLGSLSTMSFIALLLVGSAIAHLGREWPWLYVARVAPAVLLLTMGTMLMAPTHFPVITVTVAVALGMVAAGGTEQARRLTHYPTIAAAAAALPMVLAVGLVSGSRLTVAAALSALFLALSALLAHLRDRIAAHSLWLAPLAAGTALLILSATALTPGALAGIALAMASGAYGVVAIWRRSMVVAVAATVLAGFSSLGFLTAVVSTTTVYLSTGEATPLTLGHGLVLTVLALLAMTFSAALTGGVRNPVITRGAAAVAFVTGSATVITTGTWVGTLADNARAGFYGGHAVATALWTALAAVLMTAVARRSRDGAFMARIGLVLVAAAVAKLFLFDLSALSGLFRVVAFVVSGIIVLVLGVLVARDQGITAGGAAQHP